MIDLGKEIGMIGKFVTTDPKTHSDTGKAHLGSRGNRRFISWLRWDGGANNHLTGGLDMKKSFETVILLMCLAILWPSSHAIAGFFPSDKGCKILFVEIKGLNDSDTQVSSPTYVKEALSKGGGRIVLDASVIRAIDADYVTKYATSNEEGNFFTHPAFLNFVGGQGWTFVQDAGRYYIFIKER